MEVGVMRQSPIPDPNDHVIRIAAGLLVARESLVPDEQGSVNHEALVS